MSISTTSPLSLSDVKGTLTKESDDACVVLGAALLQSALGRLFVRRLHADSHHLLNCYGPLGTYPTRIQLAHGLGWIDDVVRDDLAIVHNIREDIILGAGRSPFASAIVAERCGVLKVAARLLGAGTEDGLGLHDGMTVAVEPVGGSAVQAARRRFEVTVELLTQHLDSLPEHRVETA